VKKIAKPAIAGFAIFIDEKMLSGFSY